MKKILFCLCSLAVLSSCSKNAQNVLRDTENIRNIKSESFIPARPPGAGAGGSPVYYDAINELYKTEFGGGLYSASFPYPLDITEGHDGKYFSPGNILSGVNENGVLDVSVNGPFITVVSGNASGFDPNIRKKLKKYQQQLDDFFNRTKDSVGAPKQPFLPTLQPKGTPSISIHYGTFLTSYKTLPTHIVIASGIVEESKN